MSHLPGAGVLWCGNAVERRSGKYFGAGTALRQISLATGGTPVVKVRGGVGGLSPPASTLAPLLESEPSLPTAGPKLLNSTKNHNVRCRINKF